jgi:oligopeptide/dipeptide ABC transporter ATP-binding protein
MNEVLLRVEDLQVLFARENIISVGVKDISFTVHKGVNLALVGESGCGKSVTSLSCMRLLGNNARIARGTISFEGRDITGLPEKEMRKIRGEQMAMVFQEPMMSLNPVLTIGYQIGEVLKLHTDMAPGRIRERCRELLRQVGIAEVDKALQGYPHELSGGMRQRVMIALALACKPRLLIADEPTTALDVTIQAQILSLLKELMEETGITIMIITHDFGVVAEMAEEVVVMYAGLAVEKGAVGDIFKRPLHPYTEGLLRSIIPLDASMENPLYSIPGMAPSISAEDTGCPFYARCPYGTDMCNEKLPALREDKSGHFVRCFLGRAL